MEVDMVKSPWLKRRRHTTPLLGMVFPGRAVEQVVEQGPRPEPPKGIKVRTSSRSEGASRGRHQPARAPHSGLWPPLINRLSRVLTKALWKDAGE